MKKVLFIASSQPNRNHPSKGVYVHNLASALSEFYKVDVLSFRNIFKKERLESQQLNENYKTKYLYIPALPIVYENKSISKLLRYLNYILFNIYVVNNKNKFKHYDIIYSHFINPNGIYAYSLSRFVKRNYVLSLGESDISAALDMNYNFLNKEVIKNAYAILCVSEQIQSVINNRYKECINQLYYYPNGPNKKYFKHFSKQSARKNLNFDSDWKIIIFVGQFIDRKGFNVVLEFLKSNPEYKGIFIGAGNDFVSFENVLFTGEIENKHLPVYLNAADVFVLPTAAEGCSNAIAEAMACGKPIISTKIPEIEDQVYKGSSFLLKHVNSKNIQEAVEYIFCNLTRFEKEAVKAVGLYSSTDRANFVSSILEKAKTYE